MHDGRRLPAIVVEIVSGGPIEETDGEFFDGDLVPQSCRGQFAIISKVLGNEPLIFFPTYLAPVLPQVEIFALEGDNRLSRVLVKPIGGYPFFGHFDVPFMREKIFTRYYRVNLAFAARQTV